MFLESAKSVNGDDAATEFSKILLVYNNFLTDKISSFILGGVDVRKTDRWRRGYMLMTEQVCHCFIG